MVRLVKEEEIRARVAAVFERRREALETLVPGASIEHIGSTAVPGSLTKGDLDICVLVEDADFERTAGLLAEHLTVHQPENWSASFASFTAPAEEGVEVGVQLIVRGSPDERWFLGWRDRLRADPALLADYDELKRRYADRGVDAYRDAKERLILGSERPR